MRLDQGIQPKAMGVREQSRRARVVEIAQEQQHGVRPGQLRLQQLELFGEEALCK